MLLALLVSLLAGLATSIGGLMVLNKKTLQRSYLAVALAFAAGAMLIISLFQIVPLGIEYMESTTSDRMALVVVWVSFFAGIALVLTIDRLLPDVLNPNEMEGREDDMSVGDQASTRHLMRSGALVAVAGGGDTVAALNHAGTSDDMTFVSTAGGAFLEWMEGKVLPGVEALRA